MVGSAAGRGQREPHGRQRTRTVVDGERARG